MSVRDDIERVLDDALRKKYSGARRSDNVEDRRGETAQAERYRQFGATLGMIGGAALGWRMGARLKSLTARQAATGAGLLGGVAAGNAAGNAMADRYLAVNEQKRKSRTRK